MQLVGNFQVQRTNFPKLSRLPRTLRSGQIRAWDEYSWGSSSSRPIDSSSVSHDIFYEKSGRPKWGPG